MLISFSKMHGLGNDFVVIDAIQQQTALTPGQIRFLADRRFGIGCDQLLLVEQAESPMADFRYRIFNADGSEVGQCGNGARCFARYVHDKGLTQKREIRVETLGGPMTLLLEQDGQVTVNMGIPRLQPQEIPFTASQQAPLYTLQVNVPGEHAVSLEISALSMGNPHAVMLVDHLDSAPVQTLGPAVESHPRFPQRANVGFMQVVDRTRFRLRVYERGAGETMACGSGACAAAVSGRLRGLLDERVIAELTGGQLVISWKGEGQPVFMTGPAAHVFDGTIDL